VADIDVKEHFNPRVANSKALAASVDELAASIKALGVLQPIVVTKNRSGRHTLIAGHRRLAAAKKAKLESIPAMVREDDGALAAAIAENVLREDLTPIEEAAAVNALMEQEGLSQKGASERLGKKPAWVRDRLKLLKLPAKAQEGVQDGKIPLTMTPLLLTVTEKSEVLGDAVAKIMASGKIKPGDLEIEGPAFAVELALDQWRGKKDRPPAVNVRWLRLSDMIPGAENKELRERLVAVKGDLHFAFSQKQIDAARAYGCLLEFKGDKYGFNSDYYVTDWNWLRTEAESLIAEKEKGKGKPAEKLDEPDEDAPPDKKAEAAAKREAAKKAKELEDAKKKVAAARNANLEFGRTLAKNLNAPKLTMPMAKAIAALVIGNDAGGIALRGMRYIAEDWQTVEVKELKSGETRTKVIYPDRADVEEKFWAWLNAAKTPGQLLGRVLQAASAAEFADEACVAQSNRAFFSFSTPWDGSVLGDLRGLLREVAEPSMPKGIVAANKGRKL
jgi:ParB/RepB/Spo0J family partition protein